MLGPNVILARVKRIEPPLDAPAIELPAAAQLTTVHFEDGRKAFLKPGDDRSAAYAGILHKLALMARPVYVEIDPESQIVSYVLIPLSARVTRLLTKPSGDVEVQLKGSNVRHKLKAARPDYKELLSVLESSYAGGSPVVLTETDAEHEIIDVQEGLKPA